ncbi:unnamed protein product [Pylaiella littoralis]
MMSQVKEGDYGVVDLWYDYDAGHNLNVIQTQSGEEDGPLFDNERANGTTYYYSPAKAKAKYCNIIDFGVGLLKPDWLKGATFLGEEECGIYQCTKWEQGEIPEAHARLLGLRGDYHYNDPAEEPSRNIPQPKEVLRAAAATAGGVSSLRRGEIDGGLEVSGAKAGQGGGKFITYWSEKGTDRPVKWVFFTNAYFQVIRFDEGATVPDEMMQIPDYCFEDKE